jgi:hypothetical protein
VSDAIELATGLWCIPTTAANAYLWSAGYGGPGVGGPGVGGPARALAAVTEQ